MNPSDWAAAVGAAYAGAANSREVVALLMRTSPVCHHKHWLRTRVVVHPGVATNAGEGRASSCCRTDKVVLGACPWELICHMLTAHLLSEHSK